MGLESATYINGLVATNPTGVDLRLEGDDHLRLIKSTIKNTFPNIDAAVTASPAELNVVDGFTGSTADLNLLGTLSSTSSSANQASTLAAVTINAKRGRIITFSEPTAISYNRNAFTVNNSTVNANSIILLSGLGNSASPVTSKILDYNVSRKGAGFFEITVHTFGFTFTGTWTFDFLVIG